jgi:uncharacterized protein
MRRIFGMVVLVAALLSGGNAFAQSPSPESLAAAKELIFTAKLADQFKALMPIIINGLKPAIVQNRPQVEKDYDEIMPLMMGAMNARLDQLIEQIAGLYAKFFTADELRQVTAFYRQPAGQKFLRHMPVLMQEGMAMGQKFGESIAAEMQRQIVDELRKRGHNI